MGIRKLIYSILAWIAAFSLLGSACIFTMLVHNQDNGRVVNYSGIVRGGTQRALKLHLLEQPVDDIAANLEKIMDGLIDGDKDLGLPRAKDKDFIAKMTAVRDYWENDLKKELIHAPGQHSPESLREKSEVFFNMTNEAVSSAEAFTAKGILMMKVVSVATLLINLFCILVIAHVIRRKVLQPIQELKDDVTLVARGDLSVQVGYRSKNELGALADSLRNTISSLSGYIAEISRQLGELSSGNLDIEQTIKFHGDFVAIRESLETIVDALNQTMSGISDSADQVAYGSSQVAANMQTLASGSFEEAQSMEELTKTVKKIYEHVKNTEEHAREAKDKVQKVSGEIVLCGDRMQDMLTAMDRISQSSAGIEKITKTIEDIAFQTNILALNAAVEAARAGTAGKGFSVVADEVRSLASKSSDSVKDTAVLINDSISAVQNGTETANETAELLRGVIGMAKDVVSAVDAITRATEEQSHSIEGISLGIQRVTGVVQSSNAVTKESATASEELSGQAEMLKELVARFHLKQDR